MRRTKQTREADAILVGDLHLTDRTPVARTDDYRAAQEGKLDFINNLSNQNGQCPVLCPGDVFDYWKASPQLCVWAGDHLPTQLITIPGNHDLPMHSMEMYGKSALHLIETFSCIPVLKHIPAKTRIPRASYPREVMILHELIFPSGDDDLSKVAEGRTAKEVLDEHGDTADLILTGDNHQTFIEEQAGTLLVNPGSMMRMTADQADHVPTVYLYFARDHEVQPVEIPTEENVISREHLDRVAERDERITAYIERLSRDWSSGLNFRQNLEGFFQQNKVPKKVREVVWDHLET